MNLYDPQRPLLANGRRGWLRDHISIPAFEVYPLEDNTIELSLFLPIKDAMFTAKKFTIILHQEYLCSFLMNFKNDPEAICETYFKSQIPELMPELRRSPRQNSLEQNLETSANHTDFRLNRKKSKPTLALTNLDF